MSYKYTSNSLVMSSLGDLPLFQNIKDELIRESERSTDNSNRLKPFFNNLRGGPVTKKNKLGTTRKREKFRQPLPLAAYNTFEAVPFYPNERSHRNNKFDELLMKEEQMQKSKKEIRYLGWNYIRSVGINKTMNQLEVERRRRKEEEANNNDDINVSNDVYRWQNVPLADQAQQRTVRTLLQENIDDNSNSFQDLNELEEEHEEHEEQEQELSEEDEISYDYDAEYARIEDDGEEGENRNGLGLDTVINADDSHLLFHQDTHASLARRVTRGLSIQQFVETSHNGNNPYETDDEYEYHRIDVDPYLVDSNDFTEVPPLNVSDTIQLVDGHRVSSLNEAGHGMTIEQFEHSTNHHFS